MICPYSSFYVCPHVEDDDPLFYMRFWREMKSFLIEASFVNPSDFSGAPDVLKLMTSIERVFRK